MAILHFVNVAHNVERHIAVSVGGQMHPVLAHKHPHCRGTLGGGHGACIVNARAHIARQNLLILGVNFYKFVTMSPLLIKLVELSPFVGASPLIFHASWKYAGEAVNLL